MGPEIDDISRWRDRLTRRAEVWLARAGDAQRGPAFAALSVEPFFFAWRTATPPPPLRPGAAPDVTLWAALTDEATPVVMPEVEIRSPIAPRSSYRTIEAWTEADLASIHALWWLGRRRSRADWTTRALGAADWHLEHIQPDNATNRPWAIHVFLDLWRRRGIVEARLHAETMLHNADAGAGTAAAGPGALIAQIAADSAEALDQIIREM